MTRMTAQERRVIPWRLGEVLMPRQRWDLVKQASEIFSTLSDAPLKNLWELSRLVGAPRYMPKGETPLETVAFRLAPKRGGREGVESICKALLKLNPEQVERLAKMATSK